MALPDALDLVAVARTRLADELASLPQWGSPTFWARLHENKDANGLSSGTIAHLLRLATRLRDAQATRALFTLLLERIAGSSAAWARRSVARMAGIDAEERSAIVEDLEQELALHLWEQLGLRSGESWELFFSRSLEFAQRHIATSYLRRNGYWRDPAAAHPTRGVALALSLLERDTDDVRPSLPALASEPLAAADLADLRALVVGLPPRERTAIVLRFWQGANEQQIAAALGGVTPRTVRNILRRAYVRLRSQYEREEPGI